MNIDIDIDILILNLGGQVESHREKGVRKSEEKQGSRDPGCQPAAPGSGSSLEKTRVCLLEGGTDTKGAPGTTGQRSFSC